MVFDINVCDGFIKKPREVCLQWNQCGVCAKLMELCQTAVITGPSFQWKGNLKELFCFPSLLSLVASVGQTMSVEFSADMTWEGLLKHWETRAEFRIMLTGWRNVLVKAGWIGTEPRAEKYSLGRKNTFVTIRQFCNFGSSLKNYVELIVTRGLNKSH